MTSEHAVVPQSYGARTIDVLLVDDQRLVCAAIEGLLSNERDVALYTCLDANEALAKVLELKPAVVLQDLVMPGVDGLTLLRSYRAHPATARTAVIVLSASDDNATRERAMMAGATDYLVKLPSKQVLLDCIRRHSKHGNAMAPAMPPSQTTADDGGPTLDRSVLAALAPEGPKHDAFTQLLLDQFIEEAMTQIALLEHASAQQDDRTIQAAAHRLRGSALTVGARRLAALCGEVEHAAHAQRGGVDRERVATIAVELDRLCEACRGRGVGSDR